MSLTDEKRAVYRQQLEKALAAPDLVALDLRATYQTCEFESHRVAVSHYVPESDRPYKQPADA